MHASFFIEFVSILVTAVKQIVSFAASLGWQLLPEKHLNQLGAYRWRLWGEKMKKIGKLVLTRNSKDFLADPWPIADFQTR